MWRAAGVLLAELLGIAGCVRHSPPAHAPRPSLHYVLGAAYQAGGHWYYPAENYAFDQTGIAALGTAHGGLTADGEWRDAPMAAGAMQTIQLPAIVIVTDLENGRQTRLRVNDRGPASPGRLIALSPRAALLLDMRAPAARVRVQLDQAASRALVDQLGGGPRLAMVAAPAGAISAQDLPAPGASGAPGRPVALGGRLPDRPAELVPDRLPEIVRLVGPDPGQLWLRCGSFGRFDYANQMAADLAGLGGDVLRSGDGRQTTFAVRAGPFRDIAEADAALAEALRRGVVDARITVE